MEKKINLVELLKDCPKGMELDCTSYSNVSFDKISDDKKAIYPIFCYITDEEDNCSSISFTENGCESKRYGAKCVIFPKGKTSWEGFVPPCKFKDGDIIADNYGNVCIYKGGMCYNRKLADYYCGYLKYDDKFLIKEEKNDRHFGCITERHLATEEEKGRLFDTIKANGYKWNTETKTLEKLIEPKFKVGNRIKKKDSNEDIVLITDIADNYYIVETKYGMEVTISISIQNNYELVPNKFDITTLKPFESRVLARDTHTEKWKSNFWGFYDIDHAMNYPYECCGTSFTQCIPYEGNEHLLGTTNDCDEFYKTWE